MDLLTNKDKLNGHGHIQGTRTRSEDTDTLKRHGNTHETPTRSGDKGTLGRQGYARGTRTRPGDTDKLEFHGHGTVETRKSCKLGIITVIFPKVIVTQKLASIYFTYI